MSEMNVDFIANGEAIGNTAQRLLANGMDPMALRPYIGNDGKPYMTKMIGNKAVAVPVSNATLQKDEWLQFDEAVLKAYQNRLVGVKDLYDRNLVYRIGNGLGTTVLEYQTMTDIQGAQVSMDAATRGRKDRPEFDSAYLPLPIVHMDFSFNIRQLTASRSKGSPLDTTMAEQCARKCAEKVEEHLFNGADAYSFGGGTIRGYLDHASRNTGSLNPAWTGSAATGATIVDDVRAMKQAAINDRAFGPYVLYVPTAYETVLDDDYVSGYPKTIRTRILEISGIEDVKVSDTLTAANVVLVQMTSDVIRMVEGLGITVVEWSTEGGMVLNYKVMVIQVPQVRADSEGRSGIQHWS